MGYAIKRIKVRRHGHNMQVIASVLLAGYRVERNGLNGYRAFALIEPDGCCDICSAGSPRAACVRALRQLEVNI